MTRRSAAIRALFWLALVAVLALSLWPSPQPPPVSTGWDKSDHVLAYFVLGILGLGGYGKVPRVQIALLAYGGAIELLQGLTDYRTAAWGDWLADAIGLGLAWVVGSIARRWVGARYTRPGLPPSPAESNAPRRDPSS